MQERRERTLAVRISESELAAYKAALVLLRRQSGEDWDVSRLVREGARMLAETAREGGAR